MRVVLIAVAWFGFGFGMTELLAETLVSAQSVEYPDTASTSVPRQTSTGNPGDGALARP